MVHQPEPVHIFGDDSSKGGLPFFVYGSFQCNESKLPKVMEKLQRAVDAYGHEIKWNETRNLAVNLRFLNALFESWTSLSYRCIVVRNKDINNAVPWKDRPRLRAKLVFTHLDTYRKSSPLAQPRFFVTLDKDEFDTAVQTITLNRRFWREHGGNEEVFSVVDCDSKSHLMLQAADIFTGAIAWIWNGGLERETVSNAHAHRLAVASLIAKRMRIPPRRIKGQITIPQGDVRCLGYSTVPAHEKGFSIWELKLAKSDKFKQ